MLFIDTNYQLFHATHTHTVLYHKTFLSNNY